jgi:alpha-beta hydrolase superfamily lysophospholipase
MEDPMTTRSELEIDVTDSLQLGEPLNQAAWVFSPEHPERAPAVLICLAGGTYSKAYWHLDIPGHPGYSFAEHLAGCGFIVIALDHLGVGESTRPAEFDKLRLTTLATGDAEAVRQIKAAVAEGTLADGLPPLPDLPVIGVGHSMGACLTTMVQVETAPYDALALLGYSVDITGVHQQTETAEELAARMAQSEASIRQHTGHTWDEGYILMPRGYLHQLFHWPDVPAEVIAADDAAQSTLPRWCGVEVTTAGYLRSYAARIDVPVLLSFGEVDVVAAARHEPVNYGSCADISLFVLGASGHCHNFAGTRFQLWDHIASWAGRRATPSHPGSG